MVWLDGPRPAPKALVNNFRLKMSMSYASMKKLPKIWHSQSEFAEFLTKSTFDELTLMEKILFIKHRFDKLQITLIGQHALDTNAGKQLS